jgi:hypothetical protein
MEIQIYTSVESEPLGRSVHLTNEEWLVISQTLEAFSSTYRDQQSKIVATYVTRGQLDQAIYEANRMSEMLRRLDVLHAKVV